MFGAFALFDEPGHRDFGGGQIVEFRGQFVGEGGNDAVQIGFQHLQIGFQFAVFERMLPYLLNIRRHELFDVGHHLFFKLGAVGVPLLQQNLQGRVEETGRLLITFLRFLCGGSIVN